MPVVAAALLFGDLLALDADAKRALFDEANERFRAGNELAARDPDAARDAYLAAALRYERLVREGGVRNGDLFYNLGNAYFQAGDLGRAILNYRRALLYAPGDPNLRRNLAYARSRKPERFEPTGTERALRTVLFWHYELSARLRSAIFAAFWIAFWTAAAARRFRPGAAPRGVLVACAAGALIFGSSVIADEVGARESFGVVTAAETAARTGDGESYDQAFTEPLHAGVEFNPIERRPGWILARFADGRSAWLAARDVEVAGDL